VPIPTRVVTVTEPVSALKVLLAAVKLFDTVADPVVVNVDTVVEPALIVPEVLILPPVTPPVAVIPVREEPSPIKPVVAVTVPITCSVVEGVVVPMPRLPSFLTNIRLDPAELVIFKDESALAVLLPLTSSLDPGACVPMPRLPAFIQFFSPVPPLSTTPFTPPVSNKINFPSFNPAPLDDPLPNRATGELSADETRIFLSLPYTCSISCGVVVPMPTFPDVVAMVAVPVIDSVDAVTEPVAVIVLAVIDPELPTTTPRSALSVICNI